jgi:predicted acyltransferase (DUF342 family)
MWTVALITFAALVFTIALMPTMDEYFRPTDKQPLAIQEDSRRNTNHFASVFEGLLKERAGTLAPRAPLEGNQMIGSMPSGQRTSNVLTNLVLPEGFDFPREVFSEDDIILGRNSTIRAMLSKRKLSMGAQCEVRRWAHAESIEIDDDCRLRGRLTAETSICIAGQITFERLSAPLIRLGDATALEPIANRSPEAESEPVRLPEATWHADENRLIANGDLEIPSGRSIFGDIVVRGTLKIRGNTVVHGNIKAHGSISIESSSSIIGSLVSPKEISIDRRCDIKGPILSEMRIEVASGCQIGSMAIPTTISAPIIEFTESNCIIHGSIHATALGRVARPGVGAPA